MLFKWSDFFELLSVLLKERVKITVKDDFYRDKLFNKLYKINIVYFELNMHHNIQITYLNSVIVLMKISTPFVSTYRNFQTLHSFFFFFWFPIVLLPCKSYRKDQMSYRKDQIRSTPRIIDAIMDSPQCCSKDILLSESPLSENH